MRMSDNKDFHNEEDNGFAEPPKKSGAKAMIILETILLLLLVVLLLYFLIIIRPALKGGPVSPYYPSFLQSYLPENKEAETEVTPEPTRLPTPTPTPVATKTPTPTATPTPTPTPVPTLAPEIVAMQLPSYASVSTDDWNLILVNKEHLIPEDYDFELVYYDENNVFGMDARIVEPLHDMLNDCMAAGFTPEICSAFRDSAKQVQLFDDSDYRKEHPDDDVTSVAVPGASEHEIGLAVDIFSSENHELDESQESTETQQWLMKHCWEYGFILRYPKEKESYTDIIYEPWHYRYVGKDAAKDIASRGLCLEEYLENMQKVKAAETALKEQTAALKNKP